MTIDKNRLLSTDNAKAAKALGYGWLNGIHYMAPGRSAGVGNLCLYMSPQCEKACLGTHAGRAGIVDSSGMSPVVRSRIMKAQMFMQDRHAYMNALARCVQRASVKAAREAMRLSARLNGSTDVNWSRIKFRVDALTAIMCGVPEGIFVTIPELFGSVVYNEYTKDFQRLGNVQSNIYQTFSFSGENHEECKAALAGGYSVAVVFGHGLPKMWWGHPVIDGDLHDLRHLDPANVVVGLSPKGKVAKESTSSFIIRDY
jgi:hypothetical protein